MTIAQQVAARTGEEVDSVRGFFGLETPLPGEPSAEALIANWKEKEWGPPVEAPRASRRERQLALA